MLLKMLRSVAKVLPPGLPEMLYTVLFRPRPLRRAINRVLLKLIPGEITIDGVKLYLNPCDPVLSPAVALGVYENYEMEIFRCFCKVGATVVDIGANVGLYTSIAAAQVGRGGTVIAIEPHPESYQYLEKTVRGNNLTQVRTFRIAAGDSTRTVSLFLTAGNKADSRIYDDTGQRQKILTPMVDLDRLLADNEITKVDVIKIDIQGAEALALRGMSRTLADNPHIVIFTEFWPWGIEQTGLSPVDFLRRLQEAGFSFKTINENERRVTDVEDINQLIAGHDKLQYTGLDLRRSHANLICTRR